MSTKYSKYITMADHIEYGEAPVSTTVVSQNSATLDELVAIGTSIYQEVIDYSKEHRKVTPDPPVKETPEHLENKLSRLLSRYTKEPTRKKKTAPEPEEIAVSDKDEYRDLVRTLQNKYKDFNASFPIFIRWTVQTGEYSPNALRSFLRKHAQTRLKSMEDFLQLQVNYVKYIFMEKNKHYNTDRLHRLAEDLMKALLKEEKEFKDISKEVDADMEQYKKEQITDMRRRIREHLLATKS